jgi:hypothetical protein
VPLDVYTQVHQISGNGIIVIEVRSHDFDALAAVVNGAGELVAFNDNWGGTRNARVVIDGAPAGGGGFWSSAGTTPGGFTTWSSLRAHPMILKNSSLPPTFSQVKCGDGWTRARGTQWWRTCCVQPSRTRSASITSPARCSTPSRWPKEE